MSTPLISIPHSRSYSGRARAHLTELNRVAAHPNLGASLEQIRAGIKDRASRPLDTVDPRDLVAYLIQDNQDLWQQLLHNPFCMKMKTSSSDNAAVLKGFRWHMVQDFLYCIRLMTYEADRAGKATNSEDFDTSTERVSSNAEYAKESLTTCTTPVPNGLGIKDFSVLGAYPTEALKSYTDFQISTAGVDSWVLALVAMVPCIQSYYQLAVDLKDYSTHRDTIWYNLWAVENAKYEDSTTHQKEFFIQNFDEWKDHYAEATKIFRRACQGEIDLWATALHPEDV